MRMIGLGRSQPVRTSTDILRTPLVLVGTRRESGIPPCVLEASGGVLKIPVGVFNADTVLSFRNE